MTISTLIPNKIPDDERFIINVLITISTFFLGFFIKGFIEAVAKFRKRRSYRKIMKINLRNLQTALSIQAKGYNDLQKQVVIEHNGGFAFSQKIIPSAGVINKMGYDVLFNAYFSGIENFLFKNKSQRERAFNNIWDAIEVVSKYHDKSFEDCSKFIELNIANNKKRNLGLEKVQRATEPFRLYINKTTPPENISLYFQKLEQIIKQYAEIENYRNPKVTEDYFIQPILTLNRENIDTLKTLRPVLDIVELNLALLETSLAYENQNNLMLAYNNHFYELYKSFTNEQKKIKITYK